MAQAPILATNWKLTNPLRGKTFVLNAHFFNGNIVMIGPGLNGYVSSAPTVAKANPDGSTGLWVNSGRFLTLKNGVSSQYSPRHKKIFAVGGSAAPFSFAEAAVSGNEVGAFNIVFVLDAAVATTGCATALSEDESYMYLTGGSRSGVYQTNGYVINLSSGNFSRFVIPMAVNSHKMWVWQGWLYVLGGRDTSNGYNTIYAAKIDGDGQPGRWQVAGNLPDATHAFGMVGMGDKVLIVGGQVTVSIASRVASVYSITFGDGAVTGITAEQPLPFTGTNVGVATDGKTVWALGGLAGSVLTTDSLVDVYYNKIA